MIFGKCRPDQVAEHLFIEIMIIVTVVATIISLIWG